MTATRTTRRARPAAPAEERPVFIGGFERTPRGDYAEGVSRGDRHGARFAAEALGYYVVEQPSSQSGYVSLFAVRETPREQEVIAEGLARFEAAARANPDLCRRYGRGAR